MPGKFQVRQQTTFQQQSALYHLLNTQKSAAGYHWMRERKRERNTARNEWSGEMDGWIEKLRCSHHVSLHGTLKRHFAGRGTISCMPLLVRVEYLSPCLCV